jgi:hypothetical protein
VQSKTPVTPKPAPQPKPVLAPKPAEAPKPQTFLWQQRQEEDRRNARKATNIFCKLKNITDPKQIAALRKWEDPDDWSDDGEEDFEDENGNPSFW